MATGVYGLLGVCGLVSVFFKRYALAKNFSVLWWTVTVLTTILGIVGTVLLATEAKNQVKDLCQADLLEDDHSGKYSNPNGGGLQLAYDVNDCFKWTMIFTGVATAVEFLIMSVGGYVASQYTREVRFEREGLSYTYGQGYLQPQAPVPSAHPYTHPYTKADY